MAGRFQTWFFYATVLKSAAAGEIARIFTRSARLVYLWAADPRHCGNTAVNPLDRHRDLVELLVMTGQGHVAHAAIEYLAEPLGEVLVPDRRGVSDRRSVDGVVADIACKLGGLVSEIRSSAGAAMDAACFVRVKRAAAELKAEVDQLVDAAGADGGT